MTDVTLALKDGSTTTDPRLDRIAQFDAKSRDYQIRTLLNEHAGLAAKKRRHIVTGPTLDQGQQGACSGFDGAHAMASLPFKVKKVDNEWARELYFDNQRNDEWPGGEYPGATPNYSGSSVLGLMKSLTARGLIGSYRWIGAGSQTPVDDLRDTLKYVGPVCLGVNWYDSMFNTQPSGALEVAVTATPAGGHAICAHDYVSKKLPGTDKRRDYIVLQNSWGPSWGTTYKGKTGFAYVLVEDIETLLAQQGEGAVPLKAAA